MIDEATLATPEELTIVRDALSVLADKLAASCEDAYERMCLAAFSACDRLEERIAAAAREREQLRGELERSREMHAAALAELDKRSASAFALPQMERERDEARAERNAALRELAAVRDQIAT